MNKRLLTGLAVAGTLAIGAPMLVSAQGGQAPGGDAPRAGMQRDDASPRHERMYRHDRHGEHRMHHHGGDHMGGFGFGPRAMRGLDLSEEQRDKLFELRHAAAPKFREQGKALRHAHRELRTLSMSDGYDEAKAAAIGERAAKAMAEMVQLRARNENELWKLLTPEQRQKLADRAKRGEQKRGPRG
ncbi:MAG TPA: Spy/CpxP family protein refolding chaperone [Burkholderiaceae bacterium]|nr:Spy/CpxP family protein refolding chaperone [Burkholderiaceae bacterium]